ncbi:MAG: hypothetical protein KDC24_07350, partial [Saprospiraceae bacterium]|nr:hypothetical protein [Saprospiraceae bacterium]
MRNLILLLVLFLGFGAYGQSEKDYRKKARETFAEMDYPAALEHYKTLIRIDSNDINAVYHAAISADYSDAFSQALYYYQRLSQTPGFADSTQYHHAKYKQGMMEKRLGFYETAIETFNEFAASPFGTDSLKNLAIQEIKACEWSIQVQEEEADSLDMFHYGPEVNSFYSDFGALFQDGALYYTSAYQEGIEPDDADDPTTRVYRYEDGAEKGVIIPSNPDSME